VTAVATDAGPEGIVLRARTDRALVVSFDGRYVFATTPARDGRPRGAGVLVPWPAVLQPFLRGSTRVQVADPVDDAVLVDVEVRFDDGDGRVDVVDGRGHPLAVDKVGHLARAFVETDDTVRDEILDGTQRALADLRDHCGVTAYLNYGALLGAVRGGRMIAHDSDTDVCYLSSCTTPAELITESYRIERVLRDRGWRLMRMSGGDVKLLLPLSDGRTCHIDVFVAFRVAGTFYQLGNRSGALEESAIVPLGSIELHGRTFAAPADPEAMLAFLYGPHWRTPDPSFKYADPPAGVRRLDGWLRGFRDDVGAWSTLHEGGALGKGRRPSPFARWVRAQVPRGAPVADLGSGTGRDALWYAGHDHPVHAFDFSRPARRGLARRARRQGLDVDVRPLALGDLRSVLSTGAELARGGHHLHVRLLLGCLDDAARRNLWVLARMAGRGGGLTFVELSALDPARHLVDPGPAGLVRRLDPAVVRREVEESGGVVEVEERGAGADVLGQQDPYVVRMRLRWPHPTEERNPR
jgi:hypothetical protein